VPVALLNRQRRLRLDVRRLRALMERAIEAAGVADREVGVVLLSDAAIHRMNRFWRGVDRPTDCISFPAAEGDDGDLAGPILGDIAISVDTALRQGREHAPRGTPDGMALDAEVLFLFVHSLLHLMGHDHRRAAGARRMRGLEEAVLAAVVPVQRM